MGPYIVCLFRSQWKTLSLIKCMQLSCLDDLVTLACNLQTQCQSSLFKELDTLRRQAQSPNSFQKRRGQEACNVCVFTLTQH